MWVSNFCFEFEPKEVGIHSLDAVQHCNYFNTKIQTNLNELDVKDLMEMSLLKKIDDYAVGGLNIDSSNILLYMGKPHEIGSRRWNWKFQEKHFKDPNPELLLHSSYSFWP